MTSVVENQGTTAPHRAATLNRPDMVSVGTIMFLSQELMLFAGLFAMHFVSCANDQGDSWDWGTDHFNVPYTLVTTVIPAPSSLTAQWGVFAAERDDAFAFRKRYALFTALGAVFLVGQAYGYFTLVSYGLTIQNSIYDSVFFITTGFYTAHVLTGVLVLVVVLIRISKPKFTPAQAIATVVVSYYWHFVDVVWIGLFITIYFIQ